MSEQQQFLPRHAAAMGAVAAVWGASFLLIAKSVSAFSPSLVAFIRVGLGAAVLSVIRAARQQVPRAAWPAIGALGLIWMAAPFVLFAAAEQSVSSSQAGVINGSAPLFTALAAVGWSRRLPTRRQSAGLLLGFAGVTLVYFPSLSSPGDARAALLLVAAVSLYGIAFNVTAALQRRHGALPVVWRAQVAAALLLLVPGISAASHARPEFAALSAVALLGIACTGIGFAVFSWLAGSVGATRASVTTYFLPLIAVGLGAGLRHEPISAWLLLGAPLIFVGARLSTFNSHTTSSS